MKDLPILFSGEMVRAIFAGKNMTRRVSDRWATAEVGDRLWVRETYSNVPRDNGFNVVYDTVYRATDSDSCGEKWRPSIFMPRELSRITLGITELKREPLFDISETDARREGFASRDEFLDYFKLMNKKNFKANPNYAPTTWAIGFKVLEIKGVTK